MFESNFKIFCWLLVLSYATFIFGNHHDDHQKLFEDNEETKACMKEFNITDEQVQEMDEAEEPNDNYDCFFGCVTLKEGFITENGQLNKTKISEDMAEVEDDDEKADMQSFFYKLDEELKAKATDTCSAGGVIQKFAYLDSEDEEYEDEEEE